MRITYSNPSDRIHYDLFLLMKKLEKALKEWRSDTYAFMLKESSPTEIAWKNYWEDLPEKTRKAVCQIKGLYSLLKSTFFAGSKVREN